MSADHGAGHGAEKSALSKVWGGALQFIGIFLVVVLVLFLLGPFLGMANSGIAGVNNEFRHTPQLITAFGVNFNLTMVSIFRLLFTALMIAVVVWLLGLAFQAMFKKDDGHH